MPSVLGQKISTMEKQRGLREPCVFICTVCGDGFAQYQNVLTHMSIHGPLDSFTFDGSSNGFEVPREYVLQDNGTLTALKGSARSEYSYRPSSPGLLPSHLSCPIKSTTPSLKQHPSPRDVLASKPLDSNLNKCDGKDCGCEVCGRTFTSLLSLHRHQQYRTAEGGYRCTLCCKFFKGRSELKKHFQNHTFESFRCCASCGKRFLNADALKNHATQCHSSTRSSGASENNQDLKMERNYTCKKCKLTFFWLTDFQTHSFYLCKGKKVSAAYETEPAPKVPKDNLRTCNGTSTPARNAYMSKFRIASNKNELNERTYRCGLCGEQFTELTALKEHHLIHQQKREKSIQDNVQTSSFKNLLPKENRGMRKSHVKVKNHRTFPCKLCKCVFRHSSSLSRHMKYHKGSTCELCGLPFENPSDLIKHLWVHKIEMINKQNVDQALSADKGTTSSEEQRVTGGTYKCLECGKQFGGLCVYRMHLRFHKKGKAAAEMTNLSSQDKSPCHSQVVEMGPLESTPSGESVLEKSNAEDMGENDGASAPNDEGK